MPGKSIQLDDGRMAPFPCFHPGVSRHVEKHPEPKSFDTRSTRDGRGKIWSCLMHHQLGSMCSSSNTLSCQPTSAWQNHPTSACLTLALWLSSRPATPGENGINRPSRSHRIGYTPVFAFAPWNHDSLSDLQNAFLKLATQVRLVPTWLSLQLELNT